MAKKVKKRNTVRKLTRLGKRSLGLVLPKEFLKSLKWTEREKLVVKRAKRGVTIRNARTRKKKS